MPTKGAKLETMLEEFDEAISKSQTQPEVEEKLPEGELVSEESIETTDAEVETEPEESEKTEEGLKESEEEVTESSEDVTESEEPEADEPEEAKESEEVEESEVSETEEAEESEEVEEVTKSLESVEEKETPKDEQDTTSEDKEVADVIEEKEEEPTEEVEKSLAEPSVNYEDLFVQHMEMVTKSYGALAQENKDLKEMLGVALDKLSDTLTKVNSLLTQDEAETVSKSVAIEDLIKAEHSEPEDKAVGFVSKSATVTDVAESTEVEEKSTEDAPVEAELDFKEVNASFMENLKELTLNSNDRAKVYDLRLLHSRVHSGEANESDIKAFVEFAKKS